jgi:hypothetical protein
MDLNKENIMYKTEHANEEEDILCKECGERLDDCICISDEEEEPEFDEEDEDEIDENSIPSDID